MKQKYKKEIYKNQFQDIKSADKTELLYYYQDFICHEIWQNNIKQ